MAARVSASHEVSGETLQRNAEIWEVVRTLVLGCADHNRILELFYWSQEPGLLEKARALLALPDCSRSALQSFLSRAQSQAIYAEAEPDGRLVLTFDELAANRRHERAKKTERV
jgi:hypothetical protein